MSQLSLTSGEKSDRNLLAAALIILGGGILGLAIYAGYDSIARGDTLAAFVATPFIGIVGLAVVGLGIALIRQTRRAVTCSY